MYYPYMRAKQYELYALAELSDQLVQGARCVPIIEPVSTATVLRKPIRLLRDKHIDFVLVVNPSVGKVLNDRALLHNVFVVDFLERSDRFIPGLIVTNKLSMSDLKLFLDSYKQDRVCLIHKASTSRFEEIDNAVKSRQVIHVLESEYLDPEYVNFFADHKSVILSDGFVKARNNSSYPDESAFRSDLFTYRTSGVGGFSDYLTIGERFQDSGGPANAVTIHLTERRGSNRIAVRHFISDSNESAVNPAGKQAEALVKLIQHLDATTGASFQGHGCTMFRRLHDSREFHGLGPLKQYSMMHHIELVTNIVSKQL